MFRLFLAFWRLFDHRPRCACGQLAPDFTGDGYRAICLACAVRRYGR